MSTTKTTETKDHDNRDWLIRLVYQAEASGSFSPPIVIQSAVISSPPSRSTVLTNNVPRDVYVGTDAIVGCDPVGSQVCIPS